MRVHIERDVEEIDRLEKIRRNLEQMAISEQLKIAKMQRKEEKRLK